MKTKLLWDEYSIGTFVFLYLKGVPSSLHPSHTPSPTHTAKMARTKQTARSSVGGHAPPEALHASIDKDDGKMRAWYERYKETRREGKSASMSTTQHAWVVKNHHMWPTPSPMKPSQSRSSSSSSAPPSRATPQATPQATQQASRGASPSGSSSAQSQTQESPPAGFTPNEVTQIRQACEGKSTAQVEALFRLLIAERSIPAPGLNDDYSSSDFD